jgi:hypothetical protein
MISLKRFVRASAPAPDGRRWKDPLLGAMHFFRGSTLRIALLTRVSKLPITFLLDVGAAVLYPFTLACDPFDGR